MTNPLAYSPFRHATVIPRLTGSEQLHFVSTCVACSVIPRRPLLLMSLSKARETPCDWDCALLLPASALVLSTRRSTIEPLGRCSENALTALAIASTSARLTSYS